MNKALLLIFVAIITFAVIYIIKNPDILNEFWLWLVGLAGTIGLALEGIWDFIKGLFKKPEETNTLNQK